MHFHPNKTSSLEAVGLLPASDVKCDQQCSGVLSVLMHCDLTWKFLSCTRKNRQWKTGFDTDQSPCWHPFTPARNVRYLSFPGMRLHARVNIHVILPNSSATTEIFCQNSELCNTKSGNIYCLSLHKTETSWEEKDAIKKLRVNQGRMTCSLAPDGSESCFSLQYDYSKNTGGTVYREGLKTMTMITPDNHFD